MDLYDFAVRCLEFYGTMAALFGVLFAGVGISMLVKGESSVASVVGELVSSVILWLIALHRMAAAIIRGLNEPPGDGPEQ